MTDAQAIVAGSIWGAWEILKAAGFPDMIKAKFFEKPAALSADEIKEMQAEEDEKKELKTHFEACKICVRDNQTAAHEQISVMREVHKTLVRIETLMERRER